MHINTIREKYEIMKLKKSISIASQKFDFGIYLFILK